MGPPGSQSLFSSQCWLSDGIEDREHSIKLCRKVQATRPIQTRLPQAGLGWLSVQAWLLLQLLCRPFSDIRTVTLKAARQGNVVSLVSLVASYLRPTAEGWALNHRSPLLSTVKLSQTSTTPHSIATVMAPMAEMGLLAPHHHSLGASLFEAIHTNT